MNHATSRLRALAALPFVLALAVHLLVLALWYDRLSDPLATHFGASGRADGFTSRAAFAMISTALLLGLGAGWTLLVRRTALWGAWATAGFTGALLVLLVRDNLDAADAALVSSPLANLTVAAAVAGLFALGGWALTRHVPPVDSEAPVIDGPRLPLGASEVAGWTRATGSRPLTALAVLALAVTPAVLILAPWPGAVLGLLGLVIGVPGFALARIRVSVDRRGLTVRPAIVSWPRLRIPLDEVADADVRDVDAVADYGGWGYRVRAHRTGVVLRSGEALVVRQTGGREFAVTVPDARTAAALLNTLAERHGKV
ncbi:DUF1648 domain-containing protein [Streptomyces tanashiensis]|uniref:DUF1648 domain-containing protein n=1 Tax=Streptomyces tanashiensis TaxID=67367 RepID=UPI00167CA9B1|nr:DUF1648 domain-containing protein [Streptomyces tanashiensis]GGY30040.1 hypothetical protein GCM10010299_40300 [Streptomyces tanashiensis]